MKKRGQLTIFILIAIIIIAIVLAYFLFFKKDLSEYTNPDVEKTHVIIKDCIESNLVDSVRLIGLQGGYFTLPERYFETELSKIAYGWTVYPYHCLSSGHLFFHFTIMHKQT